jgi:hypothetical protein
MNASSDKLQIREAMYLEETGHRGLTWGIIDKLVFLAKTEVHTMVKFKLRGPKARMSPLEDRIRSVWQLA